MTKKINRANRPRAMAVGQASRDIGALQRPMQRRVKVVVFQGSIDEIPEIAVTILPKYAQAGRLRLAGERNPLT